MTTMLLPEEYHYALNCIYAEQPTNLPFLWQLNNKGIISYAIGTLHCCNKNYSKPLTNILENVKRVCFEQAKEGIWSYFFKALNSYYFNEIKQRKPYANITKYLTEEEKNKLSQRFRTTCSELEKLTSVEILKREMMRLSIYPEYGFEEILSREAKRKKIPQKGLENPTDICLLIKEQLREKTNYEKINAIKYQLNTFKKIDPKGEKNHFEILLEYYHSGNQNIIELETLNTQEKTIHKRRNQSMVNNSIRYLDKPTLIAVGVAHFLGENNMIDFYQERGIKVKRL